MNNNVQTLTIINVQTVQGSEFERYWRNHIQRVQTNKGEFIDRGVTNYYKTPGHDWSKHIGQTLEVKIMPQAGKPYTWIEPTKNTMIPSKPKFESTQKSADKKCSLVVEQVKIISGGEIESNWKNDMQVVYTSQGKFIDTCTVKYHGKKGCDWPKYVGKKVEVIIKQQEGKSYAWIDLENTSESKLDVLATDDPAIANLRVLVNKLLEVSEKLPTLQNHSDWSEAIGMYAKNVNDFLENVVNRFLQLENLAKEEKINQSIGKLRDSISRELINDMHFLNTFRNRIIHSGDRELFESPVEKQAYFTNDAIAVYTKAKLLLKNLEKKLTM